MSNYVRIKKLEKSMENLEERVEKLEQRHTFSPSKGGRHTPAVVANPLPIIHNPKASRTSHNRIRTRIPTPLSSSAHIGATFSRM